MIELKGDKLHFSFPQVHAGAQLSINFQRTLRIPDDGRSYSLPPGLGSFALRHVDDFAQHVPTRWIQHGGVMLPMYQSEAMWLNFDAEYDDERDVSYPFAIKVAAGKINAVTGQSWKERLHAHPQDYLVAPRQPWLDGFCVSKGIIRQFVAMPLGQGYTAEEQISDKAEHGGVQIVVYPMKREAFERRFPRVPLTRRFMRDASSVSYLSVHAVSERASPEMGLGAGGRMKQEIYDDPFSLDDWDPTSAARCFVHIANSEIWQAITGEHPPSKLLSAHDYTNAGLPWFEYYAEKSSAVDGSAILDGLRSVADLWNRNNRSPLPDNNPVTPANVIELRKGMPKEQVREGIF